MTAPVVPAHQDRRPGGQSVPDIIKGEDLVRLAALAAYRSNGLEPGATSMSQLVEIFEGVGGFDLYSRLDCGDRLEMSEDGQGIAGLHVVEVQPAEVGAVPVIPVPLHAPVLV